MGVNRLDFVKAMCDELGKDMPAEEDIPMTSISTDLRAFVHSLPAAEPKPKRSSPKKTKVISDASEQKDGSEE